MKVALIEIGHIEIPPKGWGAIEKYMWNYKINMEKMGIVVDIKRFNDNNLEKYDIVQTHSFDQSLYLSNRGIKNIFSFDDTHAVYYGKNSDLFKKNLKAIKNSIVSILHSEYLIDFFGEKNVFYLRHGADPHIFNILNIPLREHKLLCVGKTHNNDRKGFGMAIEAAKELRLPITIVGPNEEFFNENIKYDKLNIIGNTEDNELVKIYNEHSIFLHPSSLETGHPNLTLIESIYSGTPVVGTCNVHIKGMKKIKPDKENILKGIKEVIGNYNLYRNECIECRMDHFYDWYNITKELVNIYENVLKNKR